MAVKASSAGWTRMPQLGQEPEPEVEEVFFARIGLWLEMRRDVDQVI